VANTSSARKRIKQNERRRLRNRALRSAIRSAVKTARAAELDRAVSRGVIHRNTAARKKSSLARSLAP